MNWIELLKRQTKKQTTYHIYIHAYLSFSVFLFAASATDDEDDDDDDDECWWCHCKCVFDMQCMCWYVYVRDMCIIIHNNNKKLNKEINKLLHTKSKLLVSKHVCACVYVDAQWSWSCTYDPIG